MTRAVLLDALGTLVELRPIWASLRERVPAEISDQRLIAAVRAEMAYYREHAHEGRDPDSLANLRERCSELLSRELGFEITAEQLVEAVSLEPYPEAEAALRGLAARGVSRIVVSNWDISLTEVLSRCGLAPLLDGVVTSAGAGSRKPEPRIFRVALELAGCEPAEALHVGDTPEEDLAGARAAGVRALLIDRHEPGRSSATRRVAPGRGTLAPAEHPRIRGAISSLTEIEEHLRDA